MVHEYVLRKARDLPFEAPEEDQTYLASIDMLAIPTGDYEVRVAYDVVSGAARLRGEGDRKGENEMAGSVDIYGQRKLNGVAYAYVGDLKTGLGHHVPPVRECLQLLFYALSAARIQGLDAACAELIRIGPTGKVTLEPTYMDGWQLDAVALELADLATEVRQAVAVVGGGGTPLVTAGMHCKYCPAYSACPAQRDLVARLAKPQALEKEIMEMLTPETAALAYTRISQVMEVVNRVKNAVFGFARQTPINLGEGLVLGPVEVRRTLLDTEVTYGALMDMLGATVAEDSMERKTSKAAITRALKANNKPVAPTMKKLMGMVAERGGLQQKVSERVEVHRETLKQLEDDEEES